MSLSLPFKSLISIDDLANADIAFTCLLSNPAKTGTWIRSEQGQVRDRRGTELLMIKMAKIGTTQGGGLGDYNLNNLINNYNNITIYIFIN